jgi:anthranilate phosphoribosyltransferase
MDPLKMQDFIAIVGKGQELSRDLTREQAAEAMRLLMEATATPYQIGAFLIAIRVKGESVEELVAFTETAKKYGAPLRVDQADRLIDIPLYSGKKRTFYACLPAALVMAGAGVPVLMHGYSEMPGGKIGAGAILKAAGIPTNLEAEQVETLVNRVGFGYAEISYLHLLLYRYLELRKELGVRTLINTLLRVYNPAGAKRHLIGITHPPYMERLGQALSLMGSRRALIFRGVEGESEIPLRNQDAMVELKEGEILPVRVRLEEIGLHPASKEELGLGTPLEEAERMARVLSQKEQGAALDAVLLNAGAGVYLSGKAASLKEGVALARESLETGAAAGKFFELMTVSHEV